MNNLSRKIFVIIALFSIIQTNAQSDIDFWFAAPDLQQSHGDRPIYLRIATSKQSADVTVSIPANPSFVPIKLSIKADTAVSINLSPYIDLIENTAITTTQKKGIRIQATNRITCYYDIANGFNGDMFALKGRNALGTKFTVPFQMVFTNRPSTPTTTYTSDFIVLATEDSTIIDVESPVVLNNSGNKNISIKLNKGETYVFSVLTTVAVGRPGGTLVKSNKPIAITTKDDTLGLQNCGDTAGDQLIPDRLAGQEFVILRGYFTGNSPDYYYVFATEDNTIVWVNGTQVGVLQKAGDYYTGQLGSSANVADYVETSKPVQMFQISGFGCELGGAVIPSVKCTGSKQVSITRASSNESFFVNILAPKEIIKDFLFNGTNLYVDSSKFQLVNGSSGKWYYARLQIPTELIAGGDRVLIENTKGKFHAGVIQGGPATTARFGYFSDFSSNTLLFTNNLKPGVYLLEKDTLCNRVDVNIKAQVEEAKDFTWVGPNNFTGTDSIISFKSFLPRDTGIYVVSSTTATCGTAVDSIRLIIDRPIANFDFITSGCSGDSVLFKADSSAAVRWVWNFANGVKVDTIKQIQPKIHFLKASDYNVSLKVASVRGCFSDDSLKTVRLSSKPRPAYKVQDIKCVDKSITFEDVSTIDTGSIVKWRWNFDTSNVYIEDTLSTSHNLVYNKFGQRKIKLIAESSTGCISDTFSISSLVINANPIPGFIVPEICLNDASAQFIDTTSSPDGNKNFSYQWFFNDGDSPIEKGPSYKLENTLEKDPIIKYNDTGFYKVKLIVTSNGCVDSLSQTFTVNGANPIPAFDVMNANLLCSNDSLRITNNSTVDFGNVTFLKIFWDENDTTKVTIDKDPLPGKRYAYQYTGFQTPADVKYTVRLQAYSGAASSCSKSISNPVKLLASPKVYFDSLPGICLDALPRQITQTRFDQNVAGDFTYNGAGVSSSGLFNPQLIGKADTVQLKYLYIATSGCRDSAYQDQVIWPRPIADFKFSDITCEKNDVFFTPLAKPLVGKLKDWEWNFDDGKAVVDRIDEKPVTYRYDAAATYNVSLKVTTENGCVSELKSIPVDIHYLPVVNFDLPIVCLPEGKALFTNNTSIKDGTDNALKYKWDFGDKNDTTSSMIKNPLHFYKQLGNYKVKLIAISSQQCVDSLTQVLLDVFPQPKASFESLDSACIGSTIFFSDKTDGIVKPITAWYWNFGDSSVGAIQNPSHTYKQPDTFTVRYFAKSSVGCFSDTIQKMITIHDYPKISAGLEIFALDDADTKINATAKGNRLRYQWTPSTYLSASDSLQPFIKNPQSDIIYQLKVTGSGNCSSFDQLKMHVLRKPIIPNTFTPNGDGINDTWKISNLEIYPDCLIEVYAANGQQVFKSEGYLNPWDGKKNGIDLPSGTYYYVVYPKSGRKQIVGYITLMR
ncbi:MAG: PKD domain-containing protein [Chitinophagaceae bacterium]